MAALRRNAPFVTLPFAAVVGSFEFGIFAIVFFQNVLQFFVLFATGFIGYKLEGYFSDKYTPYNGKALSIFHFFKTQL